MGRGWRFFMAFAALALTSVPQASADETPKRGGILTFTIPAELAAEF